jgi:two-component system NarL family sensor kinase
VDRGWGFAVAGLSGLAWVLGLAGLAIAVASGTVGRISWPDLTISLAYPAVALLVAHIRSARLWSALTMVSAVFSGANVATSSWADRAYVAHASGAVGAAWSAWASDWTWAISVAGFSAIAIFPDSKLPSRRWLFAPVLVVAGCVAVAAGNALQPSVGGYNIPNPFPLHWGFSANAPIAAVILAGLIGCLAASAVKVRRADGVVRRQIGWYTFGYAVTFIVLVLAVATNLPSAVLAVAPVAIAAGAAVGILKYRLYDLDMLVNRVLVWAALTTLSAVIYVVCVGFFQRLFADAATAGSALAAAAVAVAFQPLRLRVQHGVNRLIYGYRDQPDQVLREIARSLDSAVGSDAVLPALAATMARSLGLKGIVLDVDGGPQFSGPFGAAELAPGQPGHQGLVEAATARHGGTTTRILVTPRRGSSVSARDRRLLADLAPSVAMAAESQRLGRALEQGRLRALAALAEEQRRVRRDLHDGLGPVLAGLRMTIGTARRVAVTEPAAADQLLAEAQQDAQAAIEDVRRLARDLRPAALDDLGLAEALRDRLGRLLGDGCQLDFDADLPEEVLPAAVEVAVYRIASEAVLNVARHAGATRCVVRLRADGSVLILLVEDDGTGLGDAVPGVGLRSLRERAEELGGTIQLTSGSQGGTCVRAELSIAYLAGDA